MKKIELNLHKMIELVVRIKQVNINKLTTQGGTKHGKSKYYKEICTKC